MTSFFVTAIGASVVANPLRQLWPRAISEELLKGESVSIACNFAFDDLQALPAVVQARSRRWLSSMRSSCCNGLSAGRIDRGTITIDDRKAPLVGADETYTLRVEAGKVSISSKTMWGALHALTSLEMLVNKDVSPAKIVPVVIEDGPTYKHRGVMVDPSRNFLPIMLLKKVVDGLSKLKMNALHIDLINAPSFPFVAPSNPQFAKHGSYPGQNYTAAELRDLVTYGASNGVLVIFEMDTPGHSYSWGLADPTMTVCDSLADQIGVNCPEPPCGYMAMRADDGKPMKTASAVLDDLLDIVQSASELLGDAAPVHLGADEVSDWCFGANDTKQLFQGWVSGVKKVATQRGAPTVTWMESVFPMGAPLEPETSTLQFWGNAAVWDPMKPEESAKAIAEQHEQYQGALDAGYSVIYSNTSEWYLDCGAGNWLNGGKSWCDPYKSWQTVLSGNPRSGVKAEQAAQVVGGEVCLWGEQVDTNNLELKLWQRAAAAAERMWAPEASLAGCTMPVPMPLTGCWKAAQDGMRKVEAQMRAMGFVVTPTQPLYCTLNPEMCDQYH